MGNALITLDTKTFAMEASQRAQQRGQTLIRGTMAGAASYASNGDAADLSEFFPSSNFTGTVKYRVFLAPVSDTGNRLAVYDHTNKKILIYSALNTEVSGATDQSVNGIFSFIAIGE